MKEQRSSQYRKSKFEIRKIEGRPRYARFEFRVSDPILFFSTFALKVVKDSPAWRAGSCLQEKRCPASLSWRASRKSPAESWKNRNEKPECLSKAGSVVMSFRVRRGWAQGRASPVPTTSAGQTGAPFAASGRNGASSAPPRAHAVCPYRTNRNLL